MSATDPHMLAVNYLPLAKSMASKYRTIDNEEAEQEAVIALVQASNTYDPDKGLFSGYARTCISNALNALYHDTLKRSRTYNFSHLEERAKAEDHLTWEERLHDHIIGQPEDETVVLEAMIAMKQYIKTLDPVAKEILRQKIRNRSQYQIAKRTGISQPTISRILEKCKKDYHG